MAQPQQNNSRKCWIGSKNKLRIMLTPLIYWEVKATKGSSMLVFLWREILQVWNNLFQAPPSFSGDGTGFTTKTSRITAMGLRTLWLLGLALFDHSYFLHSVCPTPCCALTRSTGRVQSCDAWPKHTGSLRTLVRIRKKPTPQGVGILTLNRNEKKWTDLQTSFTEIYDTKRLETICLLK